MSLPSNKDQRPKKFKLAKNSYGGVREQLYFDSKTLRFITEAELQLLEPAQQLSLIKITPENRARLSGLAERATGH